MSGFPEEFFYKLYFTPAQLASYLKATKHTLRIAEESDVAEVIFEFAYNALIKYGITLIAQNGYRVRSVPGHHVQIIEKLSDLLGEKEIKDIGNKMRKIRNFDLYGGGILITHKNAIGYLKFVQSIFKFGSGL